MLDNLEFLDGDRDDDQLCNPIATLDPKRLVGKVDEHHLDLAAIARIDETRAIDHRYAVHRSQSAARRHETGVPVRNCHSNPGWNNGSLPRPELDTAAGTQVHAGVASVGVRRDRESVIETLQRDSHQFAPGSLRSDGIARVNATVPQLSVCQRYLAVNQSDGSMAKKVQEPLLPGNDGRWFLEVAGVVDLPPSPTSSYAALEDLDPPPPVVASETAAVAARTAAVSGSLTDSDDHDEDTFVPVAEPSGDPLNNWQPDDVSHRLGRHGFGRWVAAAVVIALLAALGAAAYFLPRQVQEEANGLAADYQESLTALRNELPNSQAALQNLTDAESSPEAVSSAVPAIGDLNARATIVVGLATAPLPDTPPFVPRTPLEALEPTRTSMLIIGAEAEGISGRLATTFTYRSTVPLLFSTPDLPTQAESAEVDALSVPLAESLADTARLIADLPPDPTFAATRELATSASQRYATWQLEYLDALREGDIARATGLIAELNAARDAIQESLNVALAEVRAEVDPKIVSLAAETETAIGAIP